MMCTTVIPSLNPGWGRECKDSFYCQDRSYITVIDNSENNLGVAASWNIGVDKVLAGKQDWLVVCSESIRFGPTGGTDLIQALSDASPETMAVEADEDLGWHLIAFRREVFEKVGYFDEMFYPAYYEDNDFSYRYQKAFATTEADYPLWPKVHFDAFMIGKAQGLNHIKEPINFVQLEELYKVKWGGVSPNETFEVPYDNPLLTYRYAQRRHVS